MLLIQIIVVLWAVYAGVRAYSRFRKKTIGAAEYMLWTAFWAAVGIAVLEPGLSQRLAHALGVGRGADAVFYLGLVGLSYAFFKLYLKIRNLEQQITALVRKMALHHSEPPDNE
jgi:small membrane protein